MSDSDDDWPIAIGAILGGDIEGRAWARVIGSLALASRPIRQGIETPLRVNVIFFVDGPVRPNLFNGVRTGSFLRKKNLLIVQAAVYPKPGDDKRAVLLPLLQECVDVAEEFARKRGIAQDLPGIRSIIDHLQNLGPDS